MKNKPSVTLRYILTVALEFVSARLPSSGPGHHPGTTNFSPSSATRRCSTSMLQMMTAFMSKHIKSERRRRSPIGARLPKGSSSNILRNIAHPPPPPPGSGCDYNKNPPLRQLCYVSPKILHHEPGSCYYLRQAPASSPTLLCFAKDFAS